MAKSLKKVRTELKKFGRMPEGLPDGKVQKGSIDIQYVPGAGAIVFMAIIESAHRRPNQYTGKVERAKYKVSMKFLDVDFSLRPDAKHDNPAVVNRKTYWFARPSLSKNGVMLKSTDPDFRFRFEKELADNKSLIGNWTRYDAKKEDKLRGVPQKQIRKTKYYSVAGRIRKTPRPGTVDDSVSPPKVGRPFENPKGLMGYSYPVQNFLDYLIDVGFITK